MAATRIHNSPPLLDKISITRWGYVDLALAVGERVEAYQDGGWLVLLAPGKVCLVTQKGSQVVRMAPQLATLRQKHLAKTK